MPRSTTQNITGLIFGRLLVLDRVDSTGRARWMCQCSCGRKVEVRAHELLRKDLKATRSCGCLRAVSQRKYVPDISLSKTREYETWHSMLDRCYNPKNARFDRYAGRGIQVCDRWRNDPVAFISDMGPRPIGCSIGRIDNDGNYSPENCRWESDVQQMRNTSRSRFYTFRGETKCLTDWCKELGVPYVTMLCRLTTAGWSVERAFTTPRVGRKGGASLRGTWHPQG